MPHWRRSTIGLGAACFVLLMLCGYLAARWTSLVVHTAFAEDQIRVFADAANRAARAEPGEAADSLAYVIDYYPSGTKQATGSRLDALVETARDSAILSIIRSLKAKTGENHGEDPKVWVKKYGTK